MKLYKITGIYLAITFIFSQSSSQIKQAKNLIKQSGLSDAEVRAAAKGRGFDDKQIDKVLNNQNNNAPSNNSEDKDFTSPDNSLDEQKSFDFNFESSNTMLEDKEENEIQKKTSQTQDGFAALEYFGYDIFDSNPELFQSSMAGVVDPDYLIGPGDEIIVMLWGETQFRQVMTVDREGFVFIPDVGQVFVNGLDLNLLESKLFRVLSKSYSSLNPMNEKATTFLDVSLGNLRPLRIQVIGEVSQPGAYIVSPSSTLFSALYYFNGPTKLGTLRDIKLIRSDEVIASIDFYDYLLSGKKPSDEKLQLDDIIYVSNRMKTVSIQGAINRPGIYELKENETLEDILSICGGLKPTAYLERSQIDRIVPFSERKILKTERIYKDINLSIATDSSRFVELYDGDRIKIFSIFDTRTNFVQIRGAVGRPGNYDIGDELSLRELIIKADSLLGDAYMNRVDIVRTNLDLSSQLIKVDLNKAMKGNTEHDISLFNSDRIRVYSIGEMTFDRTVEIVGYIKNPGVYQLHDNMTLYDLIFQSGGIIDEEFGKRVFKKRADLIRFNSDGFSREIISFDLGLLIEGDGKQNNYKLENGDKVRLYPLTIFNPVKSVSILGSVKRPNVYTYKTNMNLKDLLLEAGGLSQDVYRYNLEIARIDPSSQNESILAESIITLNLTANSILEDGESIDLRPYDYISIRPDPFFEKQKTMRIDGMVYYPGSYAILSPNEKLSNMIERAGGLRSNAFTNGSTFVRNGNKIKIDLEQILKRPESKYDLTVSDGDVLTIVQRPNMIQIIGEVNSPGYYKFNEGRRIKKIIKESGGFTQNAEPNDIFIRYANGKSKKYTRWRNPRVYDGSMIIVGTKEESEPFNRTEYLTKLSTIIANLAQAVSLILIAKG